MIFYTYVAAYQSNLLSSVLAHDFEATYVEIYYEAQGNTKSELADDDKT